MKTASKVFIILSIVVAILALVGLSSLTIGSYIGWKWVINGELLTRRYYGEIVSPIVAIVIGFCALKKLKTATCRQDLIGIGICTLILCSFFGGLFMLLIKEEDFQQGNTNIEQ